MVISDRFGAMLSDAWPCLWMNPGKNIPNVDAVRIPLNANPFPARRCRTTSSIQSAPAATPVGNDITVAGAFAPTPLSAPTIAI